MRNIKIVLQYDGTRYHGWQIQTNHDTIQKRLLDALTIILANYPVKCTGASRTDAGVHALGQVANFRLPQGNRLSCEALSHGLNSLTPDDIIITDVQETSPNFHARFDARGKTYCYQILNAPHGAIYHRPFSWHIRHPLDVDAMRAAARHLIGCHDFTSFRASSCEAETAIRTVFAIHIFARHAMVRVFIKANAFLHHMVRNIVGTLVDVGMGKMPPQAVQEILLRKNRIFAGVTAPAQGLFLLNVHYAGADLPQADLTVAPPDSEITTSEKLFNL